MRVSGPSNSNRVSRILYGHMIQYLHTPIAVSRCFNSTVIINRADAAPNPRSADDCLYWQVF